jgi:multiple sugar transport system substrate-binding protein
MFKRVRSILVLAVLIAILLGTVLPGVQAQDKVTIVWFVGLGTGTNEQQIETQNQVVESFNSSQDAIELQINIAGSNQTAPDVLSTLIASGEAPDIVGPVGFDGSNRFAGQWLDLEPLVESSGYDLAQFPTNLVDAYRTLGEGLTGLPFAIFPGVLYYNVDLFDEAGLNYPPTEFGVPYVMPDGTEVAWDYNTVVEIGKILTVDGNGNDATSPDFDPSNIVQFGFVHQWDTIRSDFHTFGANTVVDENGQVTIHENWRENAQWIWDAVWTHHIMPTDSYAASEVLGSGNAFASGKVAMARSMLWYTCCLADLDANWDLAVQPAYNGTTYAPIDMDTFRIHKDTEHPEEAFTVLSYLLGDAALDLMTAYGAYPALADIQADAIALKAEQYPSVQNWDVVALSIEAAPAPHHETWYPGYAQGQQRFTDFLVALRSDTGSELDVAAELDTLQSDLQAIVDAAE